MCRGVYKTVFSTVHCATHCLHRLSEGIRLRQGTDVMALFSCATTHLRLRRGTMSETTHICAPLRGALTCL